MSNDVVKTMVRPKTVPKPVNESIHVYILTIKASKVVKTTVTKPQWLRVVDEITKIKWSNFYKTKNGMVDHICSQFK